MDVQQVDFVASLGVAFVVDWVFFIGRVVGNDQETSCLIGHVFW